MRKFIVGLFAALVAAPGQAQDGSQHYAKAGHWEVAVEPSRQLCKMYRFYGSTDDDGIQGLVVRYDAGREIVSLTWTTQEMTYLPAVGELDLHLSFVEGNSIDDAWGSRTFNHAMPRDTRYFAHQFAGSKDAGRMLRDLAANEMIGFYLGPVLLSALFLDASEATEALRQCSLRHGDRKLP